MEIIAKLLVKKSKLKEYCALKLEEDDFHAVADAAMDLRELMVEIVITKHLEDEHNKLWALRK